MLLDKSVATFGRYLMLMGRTFSRPERMRMFFKQYIKEMSQQGVDSIGIVLLISFFIGAVICSLMWEQCGQAVSMMTGTVIISRTRSLRARAASST